MSLAGMVAVLAVFTFGMVVVFPGSVKLRLAERLGMDDAQMGRLLMAWQATTLFATLLVGPVLDRFGHQRVLLAGFILIASAIRLLAGARRPATAFLASIVLGLGGSCVNAGGNTLLPALNPANPAAASNLGNVFFGLGAFIVPFVISFLFERLSFGRALGVFALAALIAVIPAALASYPPVISGFQLSAVPEFIAHRAVLLAGFVLFCYIGLEVSSASWTTTYLRAAGLEEKRASLVFSFFWMAMMAGRLATSQLVTTESGRAVIQAAALAATVALFVMTLRRSRTAGAACVILLGLFFAPVFPTTVGITFARFNPSQYGTVFAIIFAIGLLGSSLVPAAIGAVSKKFSIRAGYRILVALALALFLLAFGL